MVGEEITLFLRQNNDVRSCSSPLVHKQGAVYIALISFKPSLCQKISSSFRRRQQGKGHTCSENSHHARQISTGKSRTTLYRLTHLCKCRERHLSRLAEQTASNGNLVSNPHQTSKKTANCSSVHLQSNFHNYGRCIKILCSARQFK